MVKVKSLEAITKKWATETPNRAPYYEEGIKDPSKDWKTAAVDGQGAYEAAMRDPQVLKLRKTKIEAVGSEKWQRKSIAVGPSRYREGVPAAEADYNAGFAPFHSVLSAVTLPEKGARGDPKNYARVKAIGDALHKKRMGSA